LTKIGELRDGRFWHRRRLGGVPQVLLVGLEGRVSRERGGLLGVHAGIGQGLVEGAAPRVDLAARLELT
jgi:hypothetical protein